MAKSKPFDHKALLAAFILKIGPTENWKGQCFAVASQAVKEGLVPGVAVYGMWHGPVAKGSYFEDRGKQIPFFNHGWVVLPDGSICDPTRWVFENVAPYIYLGPADHYDEGANELRRHEPPPEFDPLEVAEKTVVFKQHILGGRAWMFIERLLHLERYIVDDSEYEIGTVSVQMLFWIANRPPDVLGEHAAEIYQAIDRLGYKAAIPFDNRKMVERLTKAGAALSASVLNPRTGRSRQPSRASR